jgi:hypothetical protein
MQNHYQTEFRPLRSVFQKSIRWTACTSVTPVPCGSTEFVILVSKNVEKSFNFILKKKVLRCILNCYILGVSKFNRLIPVNICFNFRLWRYHFLKGQQLNEFTYLLFRNIENYGCGKINRFLAIYNMVHFNYI